MLLYQQPQQQQQQVLYTIKARSVVMISSASGGAFGEASANPAKGWDDGAMTSAALERVVDQATAAYNEW